MCPSQTCTSKEVCEQTGNELRQWSSSRAAYPLPSNAWPATSIPHNRSVCNPALRITLLLAKAQLESTTRLAEEADGAAGSSRVVAATETSSAI